MVVRDRFHGAGVNDYIVSDGFLLSLSMCKRGFHDLLRVRPSSLLMERIESSETSALKAQTPGDYPKHTIRYSTHGESLKSRIINVIYIARHLAM